jgi:hypothetical protein
MTPPRCHGGVGSRARGDGQQAHLPARTDTLPVTHINPLHPAYTLDSLITS